MKRNRNYFLYTYLLILNLQDVIYWELEYFFSSNTTFVPIVTIFNCIKSDNKGHLRTEKFINIKLNNLYLQSFHSIFSHFNILFPVFNIWFQIISFAPFIPRLYNYNIFFMATKLNFIKYCLAELIPFKRC